jgi:hypothetical protein
MNHPCGWSVARNASEGTCNGVIQDTANGDGLTHHNVDTGISIGGSNIEIRNIGIYNLWVPDGLATNPPNSNPQCIGVSTSSNITVHDMVCHDTQSFINGIYGASISGYNVYNNEVYNVNGDFTVQGLGSFTFSAVSIYGNRFHDFANWDTPSDAFHHDGIYCFSESPYSTLTNWKVFNNYWNGSYGVDLTSMWYVDNQIIIGSNVYLFNNVFAPTNAISGTGHTVLAPISGAIAQYNNTYVEASGSSSACATNIRMTNVPFENNVFQGCSIFTEASPTTFSPIDYNVYTGNATTCSGGICWYYGSRFASFGTWQTDVGGESHSVSTSASANLNGNGQPQSGSPAIGAGTNLTSLGITALNSDIAGNPRPNSGAWDAGAYSSGQSSAGAPAPPSQVVATVK